MWNRTRMHADPDGFVLLEVIVALAVAGTVLTAGLGALRDQIRFAGTAFTRLNAAAAGQSFLARSCVDAEMPDPDGISWKGRFTARERIGQLEGMNEHRVTLNWKDHGIDRSVEFFLVLPGNIGPDGGIS